MRFPGQEQADRGLQTRGAFGLGPWEQLDTLQSNSQPHSCPARELRGFFQSSMVLFWKHLEFHPVTLLMPRLHLQCSCQVSASCYTTPGSGNSLPLQARISGENVLTVKGLHLSIIFGSNYSSIHRFLHPSFLLFIISFILTMLSVIDSKINLRHVPVNWTGSWILVSSNIWPWLSKLKLQGFSPPF